jgi:hypothetical protein
MKNCGHDIFQLFNHHKKITEPRKQLYEKIITDMV